MIKGESFVPSGIRIYARNRAGARASLGNVRAAHCARHVRQWNAYVITDVSRDCVAPAHAVSMLYRLSTHHMDM